MVDVSSRYDWKPFVQGTDWARTLAFSTGGVATPLTSYHAAMVIRDQPSVSGNILLSIDDVTPTANGSVITINAASGLVTITITDLDTDNFTWMEAYYDLKLTDASSKESVPIYGKLTVIPKITT